MLQSMSWPPPQPTVNWGTSFKTCAQNIQTGYPLTPDMTCMNCQSCYYCWCTDASGEVCGQYPVSGDTTCPSSLEESFTDLCNTYY
jgi:hypothetical protein